MYKPRCHFQVLSPTSGVKSYSFQLHASNETTSKKNQCECNIQHITALTEPKRYMNK